MATYDTWASGALDSVAMALYQTAGRFFQWSDATRDHWVGKTLIFPFTEYMGDRFEEAALSVWLASDRLASIHAFVQDLLDGWLLGDLLRNLVSNWDTFRDDPVYWAFQRIVDYWPDFYWFAQDPAYMVSFWLGDTWGELQAIARGGSLWVLDQLDAQWPDFYWFRQSPTWVMRCWFVDAWPQLDGLFTEPEYWLKDRLSDMWGVPLGFWDDPLGNIRAGLAVDLETLLHDQRDQLYRTGERLLRYFIEGVF